MSFGIKIIETLQLFKVCFCISDFASMTPQSLIMAKHQYYIIKCAPLMRRHNRKVRAKQAQLVMFVHLWPLLTCSTHLLFCSFELSPRVSPASCQFKFMDERKLIKTCGRRGRKQVVSRCGPGCRSARWEINCHWWLYVTISSMHSHTHRHTHACRFTCKRATYDSHTHACIILQD